MLVPVKWEKYGGAALAALLCFIAGLSLGVYWTQSTDQVYSKMQDVQSVGSCIDDTTKSIGLNNPTVSVLKDVNAYCFAKISSQFYVYDLKINQNAFVHQNRASVVVMWMVVSITLAGVVLAALQLLAAFRMADTSIINEVGEISFSKDRIVLRSSFIGLIILTISFAFFLVFILYVYRLEKPAGRFSAEDRVERR
jgi:hypothetical protein